MDYQDTSKIVKIPLNLQSFLPKEGATFFRYFGSLTTPNCTESVKWTVIREPLYVKLSEIERFHQIHDDIGDIVTLNVRPLQKLGNRILEYLIKSEYSENICSSKQSSIVFISLLSVIIIILK